MRSPGFPSKLPDRRFGRLGAVALVLLTWSLPVSAQPAHRTKVWHGTRLVEPEPEPVIIETAPPPRELILQREPERLPPIQVHIQQPSVAVDHLQSVIATEMGHARRLDKLEITTSAMQKQIDQQAVRQASNQEPAAPRPPAKLPEMAVPPPAPVEKEPATSVKIDVAQPSGAPSLASMIFTQMAAIVGSIVVVAVLFFGLHLILARRSGLGGLFRIELIGSHAPSAGVPLPSAEAIPPEPEPEPWGEVTPNFDIGPTYEEEKKMREDAERNKEAALLQHIFEQNQKIQEEIRDQQVVTN